MKNEYNLQDLHEGLLNIMLDIDCVCRNNNIQYSLFAGTLIGAIRHHGFIPWDDDLDIVFERKEYEKFMDIYPIEKNPEYDVKKILWIDRVYIKSNSANISRSTGAVMVDIFVYDNVPDNIAISRIKLLLIKILQGMLKEHANYKKYTLIGKVLIFLTHTMGKFFSNNWKLSMYARVSKWGNDKSTAEIAVYNTLFKYLEQNFSQNMTSQYIDVIFEGKVLMSVVEYDEALTTQYGDYMTLPPLKERVPPHKRLLDQ